MSQKKLFLKGMFGTQQAEVITMGVETTSGNKCTLEVLPGGRFINYRIVFENGEALLWDSWETGEDIDETFRRYSLR